MRIDRNSLLPMLAHAADCADAKAESATGHVLLAASPDLLTVKATDHEVSGTATAAADCGAEWAMCAPVSRMLRLVQALPDGATIALTPLNDGKRVRVEAGRARYELDCLATGEFPEVSDAGGDGVALDSTALRRLLTLTAYCISTDDSRPAIAGLYLQGDGDTLRATATDGHRLATATMPAPGLTIDAILHRRALLCLRGMLDSAPTVWLAANGRNLDLRTRSTTLTARRIEANFPDWRKVVPDTAGYGGSATFDAEAMLGELSRVTPMLPGREAILRLTWTGDGLALDGRSDAGEAHAELDAEVHTPIACPTLALNPAYLRDAVKSLGGTVTMAVRDTISPVVLTSDAAGAAQCVLMPCRT